MIFWEKIRFNLFFLFIDSSINSFQLLSKRIPCIFNPTFRIKFLTYWPVPKSWSTLYLSSDSAIDFFISPMFSHYQELINMT